MMNLLKITSDTFFKKELVDKVKILYLDYKFDWKICIGLRVVFGSNTDSYW